MSDLHRCYLARVACFSILSGYSNTRSICGIKTTSDYTYTYKKRNVILPVWSGDKENQQRLEHNHEL